MIHLTHTSKVGPCNLETKCQDKIHQAAFSHVIYDDIIPCDNGDCLFPGIGDRCRNQG